MALAFALASVSHAAAVYTSLVPGSNTLAANDDGSSPSTPIGFTTNFFGTNYSNLFVNNYGNVTFGSSLATYSPFGLTGATAVPIIAPFFADVDTRNTLSGLLTYGAGSFTTNDSVARNVFVANWNGVGYYSGHANLLNTFQLVLVERSETGAGNFDIVFNYDSVQWETGDASNGTGGFGGSSARVGYSAGTGASGTFNEFAGSGVNGAFLDGGPSGTSLIHNSNVPLLDPLYTRIDGRYVMTVRNGEVSGSNDPPEPGTFALAGLALTAIGVLRRRKR